MVEAIRRAKVLQHELKSYVDHENCARLEVCESHKNYVRFESYIDYEDLACHKSYISHKDHES